MLNNNVPLTLNIRGADVKYLHVSLNKLGYTISCQELDKGAQVRWLKNFGIA